MVAAPTGTAAQAGTVVVGATTGCSTAVAPAPTLSTVQTRFIPGPIEPFGVAISPDSGHAFVTDAVGALYGYTISQSGLVSERVGSFRNQSLLGLALTRDGRYLIAAEGGGATVFNVARIEQPGSKSSSWILGRLRSHGQGAIEAAVSPDGNYVFVTLEYSNELAVFNLKHAEAHGFHHSDLVGYVPLGVAPVGIVISPNGRYIYVTSEASSPASSEGTLSAIDLSQAEDAPSHAVVSTVWAGCSPVRVVATRTSVYVTARGSDAILSFSAKDLVSHPKAALVNAVQVGAAPVGLALVNHDDTLVIADSNRFASPGAGASLAVVIVGRGHRLRLAGYVGSGSFPRDMAAVPNGSELIVSNFGSGQVETVDVSGLP
jgi:DNA-binding beta-propeller fold protein YncE